MSEENVNPEHVEIVAAMTEKANPSIGDAMRQALRAGIPWGMIIQQLLLLTGPAFIAWVMEQLKPKSDIGEPVG